MISLDDRLLVLAEDIWQHLPPIKHQAALHGLGLADLGARHGSFDLDTQQVTLNYRLVQGATPGEIALYDSAGNSPPRQYPCISRAWHTLCHELFHAIGNGTGVDRARDWLALSGFVEDWDDPPGTERYFESRPGWPMGFSSWRYQAAGTWFTRPYASRSPFEDFADACAHITLGWTASFSQAPAPLRANALAKLCYLRREVWGETGTRTVSAARQRWQAARQTIPAPLDEEAEALAEGIRRTILPQREAVLTWLRHRTGAFFDHAQAVAALMLSIGPSLLRTYRTTWTRLMEPMPSLTPTLALPIRYAAESYTSTTERLLTEVLAQPVPPDALPALVTQVYERSMTTRAAQVAVTERHRMAQMAESAVFRAQGVSYKIWRVQSATPCSFCQALDGTRIPLEQAFFLKGATIYDRAARSRTLDYEDVYHPPMHVSCRCILESAGA